MPESKTYTYVRLLEDKGGIARYEVRTSTFIEYDENPGRRAVNGKPDKKRALEIAQEIARSEKARTGAQ